jgi:uncharacterized protein YlxP (DUF503 family)
LTTFVGSLEATIYCHGSFSLKDKRRVVKSVLDRLKNDFNVAAAEVDYQDHQRKARLAFSMVGADRGRLEQQFDRLEDELTGDPEIEVREVTTAIF